MWLLVRREVGFVPNAVGSIVAVRIPGHSMSCGFRRHAFALNHQTIATVSKVPFLGLFVRAPANPLSVLFVSRNTGTASIVNPDWFHVGIELDDPFFCGLLFRRTCQGDVS